jgi:hypothetical protein
MALGWGIGFLFGVPRTSATDTSTNTNLEQISDRLTKVLVGVGLTQLAKLPTNLGLLASYIAAGYKDSANNVFALSLLLYFSALGFLTGYLLIRLALQSEFDRAGRDGTDSNPDPNSDADDNPSPTPTPAPAPANGSE